MDLLYFQSSHHLAQDSDSRWKASDWQNFGHLLIFWPEESRVHYWPDFIQFEGVIPQSKIKDSHQKKEEWIQMRQKQQMFV